LNCVIRETFAHVDDLLRVFDGAKFQRYSQWYPLPLHIISLLHNDEPESLSFKA